MKKKYLIIIIIVAIIGAGFAYFYFSKEKINYEFIEADLITINEEVTVTGRVTALEDLSLAFEVGGRLTDFYVEVGDTVEISDRIVALDNSAILAKISQYRAALDAEKARLDALRVGTREEEIQLQEIKVANAKTALNDKKESLVNSTKDSYTKADDAVRNKADQFISGPASNDPQLTFTLSNLTLELRIESQRKELEGMLVSWKASIDNLDINDDLTQYASEAKTNLNTVTLFLDDAAFAINSATIGVSSGNTWKTDISLARTNISTASGALLAAESGYNTASSNLSVVQGQLALKKAGSTPEAISAQEATVRQAEARLQDIRVQYAKTIIRAPISGIITDRMAKIGEIVTANSPVIALISEGFQIEANVPEADISKLKVGNEARVTLDAYSSDILFESVIVKINPAETIVEGVATYKVTLQFKEEDERIKPGMTANIDIKTATAQNVIAVPQRAVAIKGSDRFVKILKGEEIVEIQVTTGIRGSDGNIEILEGINKGDKVIILITE